MGFASLYPSYEASAVAQAAARSWPLARLPLVRPLARLPLALATFFAAGFACPFNFFSFSFALASFSANRLALRSAFSRSRWRSALASARCFLRFFSQASHLQPIGFR